MQNQVHGAEKRKQNILYTNNRKGFFGGGFFVKRRGGVYLKSEHSALPWLPAKGRVDRKSLLPACTAWPLSDQKTNIVLIKQTKRAKNSPPRSTQA